MAKCQDYMRPNPLRVAKFWIGQSLVVLDEGQMVRVLPMTRKGRRVPCDDYGIYMVETLDEHRNVMFIHEEHLYPG